MSDFLPSPTLSGAKLPLRPMHVWGIRVRLQVERRIRDLALFDLAIDSKLRGCDVVALRVGDVVAAGTPRRRAIVLQQKTGRPVQFEITIRHVNPLLAGWNVGRTMVAIGFSPAAYGLTNTYPPANTPVWSNGGSNLSGLSRRDMGRTAFAGQRFASSTKRPAT